MLLVPALGVPLGYYPGQLARRSLTGRRIVAIELRGMLPTPVIGIRQQRFGDATIVRRDLPAVVSDALTGPVGFVRGGRSLGGQRALLPIAAKTIRPQVR
ncbi:MAG TPA: hypothetical protein DIW46_13100 [Microbacterium sp.]|nr:hypothetical protein [Microbacterium sp.]